MIWMIVPCSQGFTKFQLNLSYLGYNTEEGAMLRSVAGAGRSTWPEHCDTFVFLLRAPASQGHIHWPGQNQKGLLEYNSV